MSYEHDYPGTRCAYDVGDGEGGPGGAGNAADAPSIAISAVAVAFAAVIGTAYPSNGVEGIASMDASAAYPDLRSIDRGALVAPDEICKICQSEDRAIMAYLATAYDAAGCYDEGWWRTWSRIRDWVSLHSIEM